VINYSTIENIFPIEIKIKKKIASHYALFWLLLELEPSRLGAD